jgi:CheY-like chemotaxis protein
MVRHLVELHGGSVQADSEGLGKGSTFTIRLPLAIDKSPAKAQLNATEGSWASTRPHLAVVESVQSLEGVSVLLVDDDRDGLQLISTMLSGRRAKVHTATSAAEALEALEWFKPDVLVSDLAMPSEDGYSLIRKLRALENTKHIPALALTAYVRIEDRTRALSAGFNMFVPKPVQPNELISAIANLAETKI